MFEPPTLKAKPKADTGGNPTRAPKPSLSTAKWSGRAADFNDSNPGQAARESPISLIGMVLGSPGQPLTPSARGVMERRFDYDFSRIRIPADQTAAALREGGLSLHHSSGRAQVLRSAVARHAGQGLQVG